MSSDISAEVAVCASRINNIEKENADQWGKMGKLDGRIDTVLTRINIILGSVAASCILLALNLMVKFLTK